MKIIKKGPRGEYDLLDSLRRAKVQNRTGAYVTDEAAAEIERLKAELDEAERCAVTEIAKRKQAEAQLAKMRGELGVAKGALAVFASSPPRKQALQAQLAEMRAALESIAANTCCDKCQEAALVARQALATDATKEKHE